jgi:hypothetical protein
MESSSTFKLEKIGRFSRKDLVSSSLFLIAFRGISAVGLEKVVYYSQAAGIFVCKNDRKHKKGFKNLSISYQKDIKQ